VERRERPSERSPRWRAVFSFFGVVGIAVILFLVVAATARLILGR
jgi:hypothetical protein